MENSSGIVFYGDYIDMNKPRPQLFQSIQEYLHALGFIIKNDNFVHGSIAFPVSAIIGHTVISFHDKAEKMGWLKDPEEQDDTFVWGNPFMMVLYGGCD